MRKCYLCGGHNFIIKNGRTRDLKKVRVLQCKDCSLVFLESFAHLKNFSYTDSKNNYEKEIKSQKNYSDLLSELKFDDERRFNEWKGLIKNKSILDFGSGAGGFLKLAKKITKRAVGVEVDDIVRFYKKEIEVKKNIEDFQDKFDVITIFHVLEHLPDPITLLKNLKKYLKSGGKIIIEVPNDDDALLGYYNLAAFRSFTYWSLHLYSYNQKTLRLIGHKAGFKKILIDYDQRFSFANHLGWLKDGKPGGQVRYQEFDDKILNKVYAERLRKMGMNDTLFAVLKN